MRALHSPRSRQKREEGVALLIAIFVLLLVCVIGIALIVSSGTESALAGNYRSATGAYYAALAGLEEGRGRLLPINPNYFNKTSPGFIPTTGTLPGRPPLPLSEVRYILNPAAGEDVLALYPDTEYDKEFAPFETLGAENIVTISSVSAAAGIPGPLYKWVRINAVTERQLHADVDNDGSQNPYLELYYDGSRLIPYTANTGHQILEITALAVLPGGTRKLLQYIVAPINPFPANFSFPAALTLAGNNVSFTGPNYSSFNANGNDQYGPAGCTPGAPPVAALGYTNGSDASQSNILTGNVMTHQANYTGAGGTTPNVSLVTLPSNFLTPGGLDALVQNITQSADLVITGNANQNSLPSGMTDSTPMTIVVKGDLTIHGSYSGYGLLLVTGNLDYDPDASWQGIILVIGKGTFNVPWNGTGGVLRGVIFVAQTRDTFGNLLASLGPSSFSYGNNGGGFNFSSCWINNAVPTVTYKTLSFHEIPQ